MGKYFPFVQISHFMVPSSSSFSSPSSSSPPLPLFLPLPALLVRQRVLRWVPDTPVASLIGLKRQAIRKAPTSFVSRCRTSIQEPHGHGVRRCCFAGTSGSTHGHGEEASGLLCVGKRRPHK